jgi:prepilin-type N-terminal cleavage/methylation domain-containing protein
MSNRKGFTLIELLIVVVIIGILAAIALPKFANTKQKAIKSAMISDLRNLATAQEAFYADSTHYATTYGTTTGPNQVTFAISQGNVIGISTGSNASGWGATVTNVGYNVGTSHCGVYVGAAFSGSQTGATAEGVPGCE